MKIKDGFVHKSIAGLDIIVPIGRRCMDFDGMITVNETGLFIWKHLEIGSNMETIINDILKEYETDRDTATACVTDFIQKLCEIGCLEESTD